MNTLENWFCSSRAWRYVTQQKLLPWLLADSHLGDHVLELGAGPGAATSELRRRAPRVTSLEYSHGLAVVLAHRISNASTSIVNASTSIVQGDAALLPFAGSTFSSTVAVLVLHHLRSSERQDRAFAEIHRVLRPGGQLFAFEIQDGWLNRVLHTNSTLVPLGLEGLNGRLTRAGFAEITVALRGGAFRFRASRKN
ncbi:MAG TPA: class I SAM-dependent methyltransferase [Candidatus Acidoferrum sp.]